MEILKRLYAYHPHALISVIILHFLSTLIEAISTQYMPMVVISCLEHESRNVLCSLVLVNVVLCVLDIFTSPIIRKKAKLRAAEYVESFRGQNVKWFLSSCTDENSDHFHNSLVLAVDHLESFLQENISQIIYRLIYGVGSIISLAVVCPIFIPIVLVLGGATFLIRACFQPKLNDLFDQQVDAKREMMIRYGHVLNNQYYYTDHNVLSRSNTLFSKWDNEFTDRKSRYAVVRGGMQISILLISELVLVIAVLGLYFDLVDNVSILLVARPVINFFNYLGITVSSTTENFELLTRFFRRYTQKTNANLLSETGEIAPSDMHTDGITFESVTFSYGEQYIIKDFSYNFHYGNMYEIRGHPGSGKSTLLKLIYNALTPQQGRIKINGISSNRNAINNTSMFYLPPNTEPFLLSLEDNILLGKEKKARYYDVIERLNIPISNITSCRHLSTGEKVRIALARGLISDRKIFLLDEMNSNLDAGNEKQIIDLLFELVCDGALVIIVNHKAHIDGAVCLEM